MTVQSDLKTVLDAYIQANFAGTLPAISAEKLNLEQLLKILETVTPVTLSGDVTIDNVGVTSSVLPTGAATETTLATLALESGGNLADLVLALGEIQTSPTANTVLARLKAISDALAFSVKTAANSLSTTIAQDQTTLTQLTAPGSTTSVSMAGYVRAFISLKVASIDTNV